MQPEQDLILQSETMCLVRSDKVLQKKTTTTQDQLIMRKFKPTAKLSNKFAMK